ncbi:NUDIX domain-containing protein [Paracoccus nototheniae]|uniref:NUDIX domain-containing protein n=1 Tax=Paracoccus nototheniae TaxID=2489002 RepID=A0ABW4DSM2_9RHOB|nr:NUDIX hydrolase [Paracoccus nototheniae]
MIARYGKPPLAGQAYRRRPGAYAILWRDGRLLLTHQQRPVPEFQLPGGGIDAPEHALAALHREVAEETGWIIGQPRYLTAYRRFCFMPDYDIYAEKRCQIWLARPIRRLSDPTEPGHSAHWMTPRQALAALQDPGSRAVLRAFLAGRQPPGSSRTT